MNPVWHFLNGVPQIGPLVSTGPISVGATPAQTGQIRLPNGGGLLWRNTTNTQDIGWYLDGANALSSGGGTANPTAISLTAATTAQSSLLSTSSSGGVGYGTGAGGAVTQLTSKATTVVLNTVSGQITMHNAALAAAAEVSFAVTNSAVAATDVIIVNHSSAGTAGAYLVGVAAVGAGSFTITVANLSAGSLSEAIVLNFAVVKGVAA